MPPPEVSVFLLTPVPPVVLAKVTVVVSPTPPTLEMPPPTTLVTVLPVTSELLSVTAALRKL